MLLSVPLTDRDLNMGTAPGQILVPPGFWAFLTLGVPRSAVDFAGLPAFGPVILHCTLLLKAAGQWKFALPEPHCRAKVQNGPERPVAGRKTSLVGA